MHKPMEECTTRVGHGGKNHDTAPCKKTAQYMRGERGCLQNLHYTLSTCRTWKRQYMPGSVGAYKIFTTHSAQVGHGSVSTGLGAWMLTRSSKHTRHIEVHMRAAGEASKIESLGEAQAASAEADVCQGCRAQAEPGEACHGCQRTTCMMRRCVSRLQSPSRTR